MIKPRRKAPRSCRARSGPWSSTMLPEYTTDTTAQNFEYLSTVYILEHLYGLLSVGAMLITILTLPLVLKFSLSVERISALLYIFQFFAKTSLRRCRCCCSHGVADIPSNRTRGKELLFRLWWGWQNSGTQSRQCTDPQRPPDKCTNVKNNLFTALWPYSADNLSASPPSQTPWSRMWRQKAWPQTWGQETCSQMWRKGACSQMWGQKTWPRLCDFHGRCSTGRSTDHDMHSTKSSGWTARSELVEPERSHGIQQSALFPCPDKHKRTRNPSFQSIKKSQRTQERQTSLTSDL